jgi:hypothetical protein
MNAWQIHRSLTAEQKQILKTKEVTLERPVEELIAMLKPLAGYDRVADKLRTPFGCTALIAIVLSIVGLFFIGELAFAGAIVALLALYAVFAMAIWRWTRAIDLSNNLSGVAIPMLAVFREDFDPAHPVRLRLDLREPTGKAKFTREDGEKKVGNVKIKDKYYTDPWMDGEAMLTDGSRLRWKVVDHIRVRTKTRRNPRGKIKTKTKYAKKCDIEVNVAMKKRDYEVKAPAEGSLKSDEKKSVVKVSHRSRHASLDPISPREIIDVIVSVYRNAKPARKEA